MLFEQSWFYRDEESPNLTDAEQDLIGAALGSDAKRWNASGDPDAMAAVVEKHPEVLERIGSRLASICIGMNGGAPPLQFLIDHGVTLEIDTSVGTYNVLHEAAWAGNADTLDVVFKAGLSDIGTIADPHTGWPTNVTLMFWAAHGGFIEVAQVLIAHGIGKYHEVPIKRNGERGISPLQEALAPSPWDAEHERTAMRLEVARILIEEGANYDAYAACARNDCDRLNAIIAETPELFVSEASHPYDTTPLHWAARANSIDCARILLEHEDADVNARTKSHRTPIQLAAEQDAADAIRLLATFGAEIDTQDRKGRTPLHRATYEGKVSAADALLEVGADPAVTNAKGKTAFEIARKEAKHFKQRRA